jgi:hypothetical protein
MREEEVAALISRRLPPGLTARPPIVRLYPDEVVVLLEMDPAGEGDPEAERSLIERRREETRSARIKVARELEHELGLPVAWGMRAGGVESLFTTRTSPVMTRLGRAEREVLDTLVAAGVAETRSSALAYAVRAFAAEHAEWLAEVRQAIAEVDRVRGRLRHRPRSGPPPADSVEQP